ncbi:MAG: hypothetical protein N4A49_08325 [Marinifilaceae bacterium]|jgi:hypothetical protein|nr:hypothetical protein [Marinifilaceae bacterium]
MKNITSFLIIALVIFMGCNNLGNGEISSKDLIDTKWSMKIAEGCINTLVFKTNRYIDYSCEMEDTLIGSYKVENGYLILLQEGSVYDKFCEEDSSEKVGKARFKLTFNKGKLKFISKEDFLNGKYVKSKHVFTSEYTYCKK